MRRAIDIDAAASKNTEAHMVIKAMRIYLSVYQKYENIPGYVMHPF